MPNSVPTAPPLPSQEVARRATVSLTLLFGAAALALIGLMQLQAAVFDGLRSFVRAEGLWAKAQKDAVLYLTRYTYSRDDSDYAAFLHAAAVNLGDRDARLALSQTPPDRQAARRGLLEGQNHPDDIETMIWFFLTFQHLEPMQRATDIWIRADEKIAALLTLGEEIRQAVRLGAPPSVLGPQLQRIDTLNQEMLLLENNFSLVLGETARGVRRLMWAASVGLLVVSLLGVAWLSRKVTRALTASAGP